MHVFNLPFSSFSFANEYAMWASFYTSPACTPAQALKVMSYKELTPEAEKCGFGIEGAHPPPGVNGAATVAFMPSGGCTWICYTKKEVVFFTLAFLLNFLSTIEIILSDCSSRIFKRSKSPKLSSPISP